jgi:hypothetical protein
MRRSVWLHSLVDDTDLPQHTDTQDTLLVRRLIQTAADLWEGAIRATGGAIVPAKSFW